jgi:lambda family phage tail tape measure protein
VTTERIDIEVREDGARVVKREFDAIADHADRADNSIESMNEELRRMSGLASSVGSAGRGIGSFAGAGEAQIASLRSELAGMQAQLDASTAQVHQLQAALAGLRMPPAIPGLAPQMARFGQQTQLARHHLLNLGFQFNDLGVQLASGANPLIAIVQQGAQITGIMQQAGIGIGGVVRAMGGMIAPLLPLIAAIGAVVGGFALFKRDINEDAEPALKEFTKTLGLTRRELLQLEDVTVTMGDMFRGLWKTIDDLTGIGDAFTNMWKKFIGAMEIVGDVIIKSVAGWSGLFVGTFNTIMETWRTFPDAFAELFIDATNGAIGGIESLINASVSGLNAFRSTILENTGLEVFPELSETKLGRMTNVFEGASQDIAQSLRENVVQATVEARQGVEGFFESWRENSIQAAKDRLQAQADDIIEKRPDKQDNTLKKLGSDLEALLNKVDPVGQALRGLADDQDLLGRALAAGLISFDQYTKFMERLPVLANEAITPLETMNRKIQEEIDLAGMSSKQREIDADLKARVIELQKSGVDVTDEESAALREQLVVLQQVNAAAKVREDILASTTGAHEKMMLVLQQAQQLQMEGAITEEQSLRVRNDALITYFNTQTDGISGALRGLLKLQQEYTNFAQMAEDAITGAFKGAEDAIVEFTKTGEINFSNFIDSLIEDIQRLLLKVAFGQLITRLTDSLFSGAGGAAGGGGGGAVEPGGAGTPWLAAHTGRGPGDPWMTIPAYHGGRGPGEHLAMIRDDESVLTPGQMRTVSGMNQQQKTVVNVYENSSNTKVTTEEQQNDVGEREIRIMIDDATAANMGTRGSRTDSILRNKYNARQRLVTR